MSRFADITDQTQAVRLLQNAYLTDHISHAYLLYGEEGAGKRMLARTFAQLLVCEDVRTEDGHAEPCGRCHACKQAEGHVHPDIREVVHEKERTVTVKNIREQVVGDCYSTPYSAKRKVYLIPDAEMMNTNAQNALLKTLEEPPSTATILLLSTARNVFLPTILSRVISVPLLPVREEALKAFLMRSRKIPDYRAAHIARTAAGNPGRAIALAEDETTAARQDLLVRMVTALPTMELQQMDQDVKTLLAEGGAFAETECLDMLRYFLRDLMVYKATRSDRDLILSDKVAYIRDAARRASYRGILAAQDAVFEAAERIRANVNKKTVLVMCMLRLREALGMTG